jgi:hypothetical protein
VLEVFKNLRRDHLCDASDGRWSRCVCYKVMGVSLLTRTSNAKTSLR